MVDARINLAVWFEKERRLEEAWECVEACLAKHPRDDQARYFRAFLRHRRKQDAAAETELRDLIKDGPQYPYVKYAARHLLGVVLDQLGQYDEAMRWLVEAKAQVRTITDIAALERGYDEGDRRRRELLAALTPEMIRRWRQEAAASNVGYQVAFLGGHPRSGTTLIEQILDAHPEVLAFDEPVAFSQEITRHIEVLPRATVSGVDHAGYAAGRPAGGDAPALREKSPARDSRGTDGARAAGQEPVTDDVAQYLAARVSRVEGHHRPARPARCGHQLFLPEHHAQCDQREFPELRTHGKALLGSHGRLASDARVGRL